MNSIHLEIITPERIAFSDSVDMITAPSSSGIIGILPGHVSLFTRLETGEVKLIRGSEESYLAIGSGLLEVADNKAVILVTSAYHAGEINEAEVLQARKKAEEALSARPLGDALTAAKVQFYRSQIALKVVRRKRKPISDLS